MKRLTIASLMLLSIIFLTATAQADLVPTRILVGAREMMAAPAAVYDGTRVLGSVNLLETLGATHGAEIGGKITVTNALGHSTDIDTVKVKGNTMLPMSKVADALDAVYSFDKDKHAFSLTSKLESVEFADGILKINCSIPVSYKVIYSSASNKLIVDLSSTKIATPANEIYIGSSVISRARIGQPDDMTTRVVLDLEKGISYKLNSQPLDSKIEIAVTEKQNQAPEASAPQSGGSKPFTVSDIKVNQLDDLHFQIVMSTSARGTITAAYAVKPAKIVLKLPGAVIADTAISYTGSHPLLSDMNIVRDSAGQPARLELSLKRPMITDIDVENNSITVMVRPPDKSGGTLADKLIVIDPGHGGGQPGARGNNVVEKDINLAIAKEVADALQRMGARVILTRNGDQAIGLPERPGVAINAGADMFISIHCNSNGTKNSATGIETYYHMYEPSSRLLAEAVHENVCSITGMCDRAARSDRSLYASGLAVLRNLEGSGIPGFLVECGYINNASDCGKLCTPAYRKKVAQGIIEGVREYIEGK